MRPSFSGPPHPSSMSFIAWDHLSDKHSRIDCAVTLPHVSSHTFSRVRHAFTAFIVRLPGDRSRDCAYYSFKLLKANVLTKWYFPEITHSSICARMRSRFNTLTNIFITRPCVSEHDVKSGPGIFLAYCAVTESLLAASNYCLYLSRVTKYCKYANSKACHLTYHEIRVHQGITPLRGIIYFALYTLPPNNLGIHEFRVSNRHIRY